MRAIPCIGGTRPRGRRAARRMGLAGGLALAAALAAAPEGARAQLARCSPTVATDAEALRATHVCADTNADGADYGGIAIATSSMEANHLKLVIGNGVVVDGSNHSNLALGYSPADSAVVYHNSGKNVEIVVEPGATIYHSVDQTSESTVGGYALRGYSHGGGVVIDFSGAITHKEAAHGDRNRHAIGLVARSGDAATRNGGGGLVVTLRKGSRIVNKGTPDSDGISDGVANGVYAHMEGTGDIGIVLERGSTIDTSATKGWPLLGWQVGSNAEGTSEGGDIAIDIREGAVVRAGETFAAVRAFIGAAGDGTQIGRIDISTAGAIDVARGRGVWAWVNAGNTLVDDPETEANEGHVIAVKGGSVVARTADAILAQNAGGASAFTILVAEGALVRAVADPDAAEDDPGVSAIRVSRAVAAGEGAVDRVVVDGAVEAMGGDGAAIVMERGGAVTVGATGRVGADSGLAIASGSAPPESPPADYEAPESDLTVTVAAGGRVTGDIRVLYAGDLMATIAGMVTGDIEGLGAGDHTVTVSEGGVVTGTIHLAASEVTVGGSVGHVLFDGGGTVTVLANGRIGDVDGVSILSKRGELVVVIVDGDGRPDGAAPRLTGRIVERGGAPKVLFQAADGRRRALGGLGTDKSAPFGAFDVGVVADADGSVRVTPDYAPRSRVYEALPSVLLGLNGPPAYRDRLAAARSPNGAWARVEAGGGARKASRSTSTAALAWDRRVHGVRTGLDIPLGPDALAGVSIHHRRATAKLAAGDGKIEASGTGFGLSGTWWLDDGVYVDGQVSATWYEADLTSGTRGTLKSGARGFGHALGLEAGRRIALGLDDLTLTPRARLARSEVDMDGFADSQGARVSLDAGRSMTGGAGLLVETAGTGESRLFGSLDVERAFSSKTRVTVSGTELPSSSRATWARLTLGGSHEWGEGRYALEGAATYAAARGGNRDYGGGLSLKLRF